MAGKSAERRRSPPEAREGWVRRYRMLLVAYGAVLLFGVYEHTTRRGLAAAGGWGCEASAASCYGVTSASVPMSDSAFWRRNARMLEVLQAVNPDEPDTEFLVGTEALSQGDAAAFIRYFEHALASGAKHNHMLLQYYAQSLLDRGADWQVVNSAVTRWRQNHPFSQERLRLQLAAGPRGPSDTDALMRALQAVGWIAGATLDRNVQDGVERWSLQIAFRPGRPIDVREAVAATTVLSLSEDQRRLYVVTCQTLEDCTVKPRFGR